MIAHFGAVTAFRSRTGLIQPTGLAHKFLSELSCFFALAISSTVQAWYLGDDVEIHRVPRTHKTLTELMTPSVVQRKRVKRPRTVRSVLALAFRALYTKAKATH